MSRSPALCHRSALVGAGALVVCLLGASAVHAGTIYVPYTVHTTRSGVDLETKVWLTNTGPNRATVELLFFSIGADGTSREGGMEPDTLSIRPGVTMLFLPGDAQRQGMLEITAPDGVVATARLVGEHPVFGTELGSEVPIVSSENLIPGGEVGHLQGWERTSNGSVTDLGVVNLSHQENPCTVKVFRVGGSQVLNTVLISFPPLSDAHFPDALGILGEKTVTDVRAEIECEGDFYPYSLLFDGESGETLFATPSGSAASTLQPPGTVPPAPTCSAGAVDCLRKDGVFFIPTLQEDYRRETFTPPPGSYSSLHFHVEVEHGAWPQPTSGLNLMWWLANSGRHFNLYGFSGLKGPGSDSILFRHGIGMPAGDKPKFSTNFPTFPGRTYVFDYVYDPANRVLDYKVLDTQGTVLYRATDRPNVNRVHIENGETITADFSNRLGINQAEPPSYGWKYKNLVIEVFP
jgi:hypothetical protein